MFVNNLVVFLFTFVASSFDLKQNWGLNQFNNFYSNDLFDSSVHNSTQDVINNSKIQVKKWMQNQTVPGVVFGLSIKGKTVWAEGFGQIDIENNVATHEKSVWRLASVSKTLTTALVAKLIEKGVLDLNATIHDYLTEEQFPRKTFEGKPVNITLRQLLSHMAGLHVSKLSDESIPVFRASNITEHISKTPFKYEKLNFKPGTQFSYSNYGFLVVGAIIEAVLKNSYQNEIKKMFVSLGMNSSFAETREMVFSHRPRYYQLSSEGFLQNCDIIDDLDVYEGEWSDGGIVSTVEDLLIFGNSMLSSFYGKKESKYRVIQSFLKKSTVEELWSPESFAKLFNRFDYGKGWIITHLPEGSDYPFKTMIWHAGGMLGTSTILYLIPSHELVGVAFANRGHVKALDQLVLNIVSNFINNNNS